MATGEEQRFTSMSSAGRALNIKSAAVRMVCNGITDSARDMATGARYTFQYARDVDSAPATPAVMRTEGSRDPTDRLDA